MSNKIQYKANMKLCSFYVTVKMTTGEDGMFMPETASTTYVYRPDSLGVYFNEERMPLAQSIFSKIVAVTYAPNPAKRLPAKMTFDMTFKIVVTGEKIIRANLISVVASRGNKQKLLDKTHEIFRKIRKACMLLPICFVDAECLTMGEAKAAQRQAEREQARAEREAEKQRKIQEREAEKQRKKAEKEAEAKRKAEEKEAERQRKREEKLAVKNMLSESDKKRIKATAL